MSGMLVASEMKKALEGDPINELTELQAKFFLMKALDITSGINCMTSLRSDVCETITSNAEAQVGYTIEDLKKEWAAYIFWLNSKTGNLINNKRELAALRSFVEFLLIPHEVVYADDEIFAVYLFNDERSDKDNG